MNNMHSMLGPSFMCIQYNKLDTIPIAYFKLFLVALESNFLYNPHSEIWAFFSELGREFAFTIPIDNGR